MIVEYIRYRIAPVQHQAFAAAYTSASEELAASGHCLRLEISQGVEEPDNFVVRIEWDSIEGHEQGFRRSPLFAPFFVKVKPFFAQIQEMKHYGVLHAGTGAGVKPIS